jgi:hypothetical protein
METKTFEQHLASLPEHERKEILAKRAIFLRGNRDQLSTHQRVFDEQMSGYRDTGEGNGGRTSRHRGGGRGAAIE